jgi:hypothetical protein
MHKSATKCNETIGKWCKNKHGASKIIDTFETYQRPWSRTKEELDDQLRLLGFNIQHGVVVKEEEEEPAYRFTTYHSEGSSNSYQDDGASLSHYGGATSWQS